MYRLMHRLIGLSVVVAMVAGLASRAHAERVVAPLDAAKVGNVDAGVGLQVAHTSVHVSGDISEQDLTATQTSALLRGGVWVVDGGRLGLTLPVALTESFTSDGDDIPVEDESGIGDLGVDAGYRIDASEQVQVALLAHLRLPTGEENHSSDGTDLEVRIPVGYQLDSGARAFAFVEYGFEGLTGDFDEGAEPDDFAGIGAGGDLRTGALSLVGSLTFRRELSEPESTDGIILGAIGACELAPGLTAGVELEYAKPFEQTPIPMVTVSASGYSALLRVEYLTGAW
jgi:hypothetical protein